MQGAAGCKALKSLGIVGGGLALPLASQVEAWIEPSRWNTRLYWRTLRGIREVAENREGSALYRQGRGKVTLGKGVTGEKMWLGFALAWGPTVGCVTGRGPAAGAGDCPSAHLPLIMAPRLLQALQRRETEVYACIESEDGCPPTAKQSPLSQVRRRWGHHAWLLTPSDPPVTGEVGAGGKWDMEVSHLLWNPSPLLVAAGLLVRTGGPEFLLCPLATVQP